ncbi:Glyoxalase/Bleomycin resistance protein/dioxygenase domain [Candidatus Rhodobacter oscarellae]|uniref:Glyoxalase/Bleomycin resistance protein/dioxygenase domain n=1 Tax=Candidatus Rhodobacter oscarellae TaxID=1675527 RepID=A0A0J9EC62_9RHOB|nr:SRPBCC domain-containing protein [Candidatus Rhodobacter lobularis]KMW60360.1 Glyoxalase/Bleomycin resistance protein/dioxygenase domain [Candidatus Rhodobacter lobularis]
MAEPVTKTVTVPLTPERAFRLFTEEMASWWPLDRHAVSAEDGGAKDVTVPAEIGAQIFETTPSGKKVPWGRVTEHRPGHRFATSWHPGRPEAEATQVEVTFDAVADGTRVTLVHSGWQALGAQQTSLRDQYQNGWDTVFVQLFAAQARRCALEPTH